MRFSNTFISVGSDSSVSVNEIKYKRFKLLMKAQYI